MKTEFLKNQLSVLVVTAFQPAAVTSVTILIMTVIIVGISISLKKIL